MATPQDAELILKLYTLRTEATMRESRAMLLTILQLESYEDLKKLQGAMGTRENAAWRQTVSYWEMCASIVLSGALDPDLFLETNGENFFIYGKIAPFFEEYTKTVGNPFMPKLTKLIEKYPAYQARYTMMLARFEAQKKQAAG